MRWGNVAKRKQYDLVGCVYDKYNRFNKYTEEEIIKIPGVTFSSLEDIDKFTAGLSGSYDLSRRLDDKYQGKNTFSIRVTNSNDNFYYKSIIYNTPDLIKIIDSLKKNSVYTTHGYRTIKIYNGNNSLFIDSWLDVEKKILEKDSEWLSGVFGENSSYYTLINRYIKGDAFENDNLILELEDAFREYEVFRKYLTNKDKVNNKSDKVKNKSTVSNVNVPSSTIPVKTSLGAIEDKLGSDISYVSSDEEKEEDEDVYDPDEYLFLSPEELEQMTAGPGNTFKGQNPKYSTDTGRRR